MPHKEAYGGPEAVEKIVDADWGNHERFNNGLE